MNDHACANCTKRFETGRADYPLQCRALPPRQDVSHFAVFPVVHPDDFCHVYFQADAEAVKRNRDASTEQQRLAGLVQATQEAALQPGSPAIGAPNVVLPPAGDDPPVKGMCDPPKRARRARADDAPKLDL